MRAVGVLGLLCLMPLPVAAEEAVREGVTANAGFVGVGLGRSGPEGMLVKVVGLYPGGPAESAGIEIGDVLRAIDSQPVSVVHDRDLLELFSAYQPGDEVEVTVLRRSEDFILGLTVVETPLEVANHQVRVRQQPEAQAMDDATIQLTQLAELASSIRLRHDADKGTVIELGPDYVATLVASPELVSLLDQLTPGDLGKELAERDVEIDLGYESGGRLRIRRVDGPIEAGDPN